MLPNFGIWFRRLKRLPTDRQETNNQTPTYTMIYVPFGPRNNILKFVTIIWKHPVQIGLDSGNLLKVSRLNY